ncbi:MAG: FAD-binding oxidoreductase [Proteobacteria bacterium]|nr:FAD-binding oxidoreductase [Pseudomonadota bacterium]
MIYSDQSPISFQDPLPEAVDVVIIGGGVIGISTAWFLNLSGVSVLVCDKGRVAGEQSSRNWGWIRQQARDPAELPIVIDSINTWEALAGGLKSNIGFTRQGVLYVAETDAQMAAQEAWLDTAAQHQLDTKMLSGSEVDALIKDKPGQWKGGMFTASDGRAEPFKAVPALATVLRERGALIREACAVRSVETQGGRVSGVITEHGRVATQSVVCAGGAWSTLFMANLGVVLPQLTVRATVARTGPAPDIYQGNASIGEVAIRRRQDGGYTIASSNTNEHFISADSFRYFFKFLPALSASARYIKLRFDEGLVTRLLPTRRWHDDQVSPFEINRVLNPAPSPRAIKLMHEGLARRLPQLAPIPFEEAWAGMIDVTPDVVPVMDEVAAYPGLYVATGFSGHGFGIGPGAGRVMADMVQGKRAIHDLSRFRLTRFSDGSRMQPGPGL